MIGPRIRQSRHTFGENTPCSSTKGRTGHTLGAAGITEAIIAALCLRHGFMPGILHTKQVDPLFQSRILLKSETSPLRRVDEQFIWLRRQQLQPRFRKDTVMQVCIQSVGLVGPGLDGWACARSIFAGLKIPTG